MHEFEAKIANWPKWDFNHEKGILGNIRSKYEICLINWLFGAKIRKNVGKNWKTGFGHFRAYWYHKLPDK